MIVTRRRIARFASRRTISRFTYFCLIPYPYQTAGPLRAAARPFLVEPAGAPVFGEPSARRP